MDSLGSTPRDMARRLRKAREKDVKGAKSDISEWTGMIVSSTTSPASSGLADMAFTKHDRDVRV